MCCGFLIYKDRRYRKETEVKKRSAGVAIMAQWLTNLARNREVVGSIPGHAQWVKDLALLWLWCRPVATAPIQPLAWEPPYAVGVALKRPKKKNKRRAK